MTSIHSIYTNNTVANGGISAAQNNSRLPNALTFGVSYKPEENLLKESLNYLKIYYRRLKSNHIDRTTEKNVAKLRKIVVKEKEVFKHKGDSELPEGKSTKFFNNVSEWLRYHNAKRFINKLTKKYEPFGSRYVSQKAAPVTTEAASFPAQNNYNSSVGAYKPAGKVFFNERVRDIKSHAGIQDNIPVEGIGNFWDAYLQSIMNKSLLYKKLWNKLKGSSIDEKLSKLENEIVDLDWARRHADNNISYMCGNIHAVAKLEKYCTAEYNHLSKKMVDGCSGLKQALQIARSGNKEEQDILPKLWSQILDDFKGCRTYKKKYMENASALEGLLKKSPMRRFVFDEMVRITKNVPKLAKRIFRLRSKIYSNPKNQEYQERIKNIVDTLREIVR